jgi:hypothetical protein
MESYLKNFCNIKPIMGFFEIVNGVGSLGEFGAFTLSENLLFLDFSDGLSIQ